MCLNLFRTDKTKSPKSLDLFSSASSSSTSSSGGLQVVTVHTTLLRSALQDKCCMKTPSLTFVFLGWLDTDAHNKFTIMCSRVNACQHHSELLCNLCNSLIMSTSMALVVRRILGAEP